MRSNKDNLERTLDEKFRNFNVRSDDIWIRIGNKLNIQQNNLLKATSSRLVKKTIISYSAIALSLVAIIMSSITLNRLNKVAMQSQVAQAIEIPAEVPAFNNSELEATSTVLTTNELQSPEKVNIEEASNYEVAKK